jgi:hypothetical protein
VTFNLAASVKPCGRQTFDWKKFEKWVF